MRNNAITELAYYGISASGKNVRWFDEKAKDEIKPEQLDYLDLLAPARRLEANEIMPDGVAENQDQPLLYFVNESRLASDAGIQQAQLRQLNRALACRGDRAYLAIVHPGSISVVPVDNDTRRENWKKIHANTPTAPTFFSRLALGRCEEFPSGKKVDFLFREIFRLVESIAGKLEQHGVAPGDVLSLIGRALFFRFLRDRNIATESDRQKFAPEAKELKHCFDNAVFAAATSRWLDDNFNGDFLPLGKGQSSEAFKAIGGRHNEHVFSQLGAIVRADEVAGDLFQTRLQLDWCDLDFAHVPVGLLSQVYEKLSWKRDERHSQETSVHYTPRNIAATLVGEAFDNLPDAHSARVLDCACGAGVFLVIAFRRIYRELWKKANKRPDTKIIRKILETQLAGFDISDEALKLTALSLYLTAIELDPTPLPVDKLKFAAMRDKDKGILFNWRKKDDPGKGPIIGSLGDHVDKRFDGAFDLVLSNPPWTALDKKHKPLAGEFKAVSKKIISRLDVELGDDYRNPDSVPDLPFLWRSLQWCKQGGRIAMALPARTLVKQDKVSKKARDTIFQLIEVTGIINASNLRKTEVWPEMDQPFMLLFARNCRPKSGHQLMFISPHADQTLNSLGEMRIDSESAQRVPVKATFTEPWLWKAMAIGTGLDVEVIRKIQAAKGCPLHEYWTKDLGLASRNGYLIAGGPNHQDARLMHGLPDLCRQDLFRFEVDVRRLSPFSRNTLHRTRIQKLAADPLRVYRGPLILFKEAPGDSRQQGWALYCKSDVAYNESFNGYSAKGHPNALLLAQYLHLFAHSRLWCYFALLTSSKFGFERPNILKKDIDDFPFIPLERLTHNQKLSVEDLSRRLLSDTPPNDGLFADIDVFFSSLYGLDDHDIEVINDTLTVREPNDELGKRASKWPTTGEIAGFAKKVESNLRPFFKVLGLQPNVELWPPSKNADSQFLVLLLTAKDLPLDSPEGIFIEKILPMAYETGATRIIQETKHGLVIGLLRQYRYWTPSRARMLCAEILRNHFSVFEE